jgi:transcriptional regulator with XRE-family HTH domain
VSELPVLPGSADVPLVKRVALFRRGLGSQRAVATSGGISTVYLRNIERGRSPLDTVDAVVQLADVLGVDRKALVLDRLRELERLEDW